MVVKTISEAMFARAYRKFIILSFIIVYHNYHKENTTKVHTILQQIK